jgi:GNAT superfamily N-acetyltransferase
VTRAVGAGQKIVVRPATPERWDDLVELFGPRGACAGCWCMYFRLSRAEFERRQGASNRRALHRLVSTGCIPGLIAYVDGVPAGWVALAPREEYPLLSRSRIPQPVDDKPAWSVVCFFTARRYRRQGLMEALLRQAAAFAKRRGARWLEGYPIDPAQGALPDTFAYHGLAAPFRKAGFREVARRSETRPIMRLELK